MLRPRGCLWRALQETLRQEALWLLQDRPPLLLAHRAGVTVDSQDMMRAAAYEDNAPCISHECRYERHAPQGYTDLRETKGRAFGCKQEQQQQRRRTCQYLGLRCMLYTAQPSHWPLVIA